VKTSKTKTKDMAIATLQPIEQNTLLVGTIISGLIYIFVSSLVSTEMFFLGTLFALISIRSYTLLAEAFTKNQNIIFSGLVVLIKLIAILVIFINVSGIAGQISAAYFVFGLLTFVPAALLTKKPMTSIE